MLGKRVEIRYVPAGDDALKDGPNDDAPGVGLSRSDKQFIAVEDGQPLASEQDTVLHETIHIVEDYMGIELTEAAVTKLATGLLAVFKDNPGYVSYLRKSEPAGGTP